MFGHKINSGVIVPTSKIALKMSCLQACDNDIDKAAKLYDYIAADLALPDMDPVVLTGFEKVKASANEIVGWIDNNKDRIMQSIDLIRGMRSTSRVQPNVPPIPDEA